MKEITAIVDPTNHFSEIPQEVLIEACGYIPDFVTNPGYMQYDLLTAIRKQYPYGDCSHIEKATVDKQGRMCYPGDPPQYPLVKITRGDEILYQYRYSFIAVIASDGHTTITRVD